MDLVNLVYRYVNKFINSNDLVKQLKNLDSEKYSKEEIEIIEKLILDIENIRENVPNEIDEIEKRRLDNVERMLVLFEDAQKNFKDEKSLKIINEKYNQMLHEKEITKDGGKLYDDIVEVLTNNSLYLKCASEMSDKDLLELITQYIYAPMTPLIDQETFNNLIEIGIKEDKREAIWRLAVNYEHKNKDFSKIEDYFIQVRDAWYLIELMSAVDENLNIDKLIDKIAATKDAEFIDDVIRRGNNICIYEEELNKLKNLK